jgi:hypothetical protein
VCFAGSSSKKSKKEQQLEAARRAAEKRKSMAGGDTPAKRTRSTVEKVTPSKVDTSHEAARKAEDAIKAVPVSSAPPEGTTEFRTPPTKAPTKTPKAKHGEASSSMSLNISLPENFLEKDVFRREDIFPGIEQFLLPNQRAQFEHRTIEELDAGVTGLSFLVSCSSYVDLLSFRYFGI